MRARAASLAVAAIVLLLAMAFMDHRVIAHAAVPAAAATPRAGFTCMQAPVLSWTLPADAYVAGQDEFNCFAWQEFIGLNWPASATMAGQPDTTAPLSRLGAPSRTGAPAPVVWETYALDTDIFRPLAAPPGPFGGEPARPAVALATSPAAAALARRPRARGFAFFVGPHVLHRISKITTRAPAVARRTTMRAGPTTSDTSVFQAFTKSWLTGQNGQVTFYEVRTNKEEFDYIVGARLYDARTQWAMAQRGTPIRLPDGYTTGVVGAIEVKAAWLPLTDTTQYTKYITAPAVIVDPATKAARQVVVGLTGLHIIHKTRSAQQFVWATFEHVSNAPDAGSAATGRYAYYNPACAPATDPYKCAVNTQPPTCAGAACNYRAPIQVMRQQPLPDYVVALNDSTQAQIRAANPSSVLQYYRLVNTMWPNKSTRDTNTFTPLASGSPKPTAGEGGLANAVLETYFQRTSARSPNPALSQPGCLACHTMAQISIKAAPTGYSKPTAYGADYSFLFHLADTSRTATRSRNTGRP